MATKFSTYFLHCLTSVHAGDGSSTGTIDSPIQREKTTDFPVFRDSTLRGGVREVFERPHFKSIDTKQKKQGDDKGFSEEEKKFIATFGFKNDGDVAAALDVYPARLLFFPVRSFKGIFAYVTCPFILKRFADDMKLFLKTDLKLNIPKIAEGRCFASDNLLINEKYLGLEEFLFEKTEDENGINYLFNLDGLKDISRLKDHYAIIDDTSFAYFTRLFTEKVTRNKIDIETGVAADTGLFNEEYLPEESILYTAFGFTNEFKEGGGLEDSDIRTYFEKNFKSLFQLGGNKSIGKGLLQAYKFTVPETETQEVTPQEQD